MCCLCVKLSCMRCLNSSVAQLVRRVLALRKLVFSLYPLRKAGSAGLLAVQFMITGCFVLMVVLSADPVQ